MWAKSEIFVFHASLGFFIFLYIFPADISADDLMISLHSDDNYSARFAIYISVFVYSFTHNSKKYTLSFLCKGQSFYQFYTFVQRCFTKWSKLSTFICIAKSVRRMGQRVSSWDKYISIQLQFYFQSSTCSSHIRKMTLMNLLHVAYYVQHVHNI